MIEWQWGNNIRANTSGSLKEEKIEKIRLGDQPWPFTLPLLPISQFDTRSLFVLSLGRVRTYVCVAMSHRCVPQRFDLEQRPSVTPTSTDSTDTGWPTPDFPGPGPAWVRETTRTPAHLSGSTRTSRSARRTGTKASGCWCVSSCL